MVVEALKAACVFLCCAGVSHIKCNSFGHIADSKLAFELVFVVLDLFKRGAFESNFWIFPGIEEIVGL